jgi:hypothetical protein
MEPTTSGPWEREFMDFVGATRPFERVQIEMEKGNRRRKKKG